MNVEEENTRSLWMDVEPPACDRLIQDIECDVLVVGAGIAGLSVAYELMKLDREVVVVDRGRFCRGQSARTSAHLSFESDDYYHRLIGAVGRDHARQYYETQSAAVDRIEDIIVAEGLECDFARVNGYLFASTDADAEILNDELKAAHEVGFADVVRCASVPALSNTSGLRFPRQARFHPLKYLNGLVGVLKAGGASLYQDAAVERLTEADGKVTAELVGGRKILARQVVVATNTPFHLVIPLHTKQAPYRSYVTAFSVEKSTVPDALFWDTDEPGYHYVRLQPGEDYDLLIVGGEDHKAGEADDAGDRIDRLEAWARQRFPSLGTRLYAWSGQVFEPADYAPYIGHSPGYKQVYLVTGDSGEGLTTGVAAGLILRDLICGRENPWSAVYDPSRLPLRPSTIGDYVKENLTVAKSMAEHVIPASNADDNHSHGAVEIASVDDLKPGQGALCHADGRKVAAYRDPEGGLHLCSASCTHAGCIVHWNGFEGCWDCPCHGSQFGTDGAVLAGPAVHPLARVEL